jgi:hypothetical protein
MSIAEFPLSKSSHKGAGRTAEGLAQCVWVQPKLVTQVNFV